MAEFSGLYRDAILDHAHHPRHAGRLHPADLAGSAVNPVCGDQLQVTLALEGDIIRDIRGAVRGCVISQASCSLMTDLVIGTSLGTAKALGAAFATALENPSGELPPELAALAPLMEVRQRRSRIGCALLPWQALAAAKKG